MPAPFEARSPPEQDIGGNSGSTQDLACRTWVEKRGRRIIRHDQHQIIVAVRPRLAAGVRAEEIDLLGVESLDETVDDERQRRVRRLDVRSVAIAVHLSSLSQWDVRVLLPWVAEPLLAQHGKRAADAATGAARGDDVVEKAAAASDEGVGEFGAVLLGARLELGGIAGIAAEDDLDGALGPHDGDLGGRPGEV